MPFAFVLNPELILEGTLMECLLATLTATAGIILISFALEGWAYWVGRLDPIARTSLVVSATLLVVPGAATDVYGAALAAATMVLKALSNRLTLRRAQ